MDVNGDVGFSSEDEADEVEYSYIDGYVPLCQDEGEPGSTVPSTVDDDEEEEEDIDDGADLDDDHYKYSVPDQLKDVAEANDTVASVEEESSHSNFKSKKEEGTMSQAHADLIRSAMAGFSLPASVTPEWAKLIPEDVWKTQLQSGLTSRQVPSMHNVKKSIEKDNERS